MEFIKQFNKCEIYSPTQQRHDHVNAIGKQSLPAGEITSQAEG